MILCESIANMCKNDLHISTNVCSSILIIKEVKTCGIHNNILPPFGIVRGDGISFNDEYTSLYIIYIFYSQTTVCLFFFSLLGEDLSCLSNTTEGMYKRENIKKPSDE